MVRYVNIFTISVSLVFAASCFPPCISFLCKAALVTVHMLLILYFLRAANRSVVFIWHVTQHRELYLPAPPSWKTVLRRSSNHHAHDNTLLYSALMNFLYSTENKPLYFPVICKVLKKSNPLTTLCHFCLFSAVPESQKDKRFLVLLKVPALGKHVLFMTVDHQDLLVWTHTKVTNQPYLLRRR